MPSLRGLDRYSNKTGESRWKRIVLDAGLAAGGTPVLPPAHIRATEPPSGTAVEGDLYFDDDLHALMQYNGSAWEEVGASLAGAAATVAGTLDVTGAATVGGTLAVTGLFSAPRKTYSTTTVLTAADSGAHCIFSVTTVTTFTLPAAAAGLHFKFSCGATAAGTSDIFRVVCASGDFFLGSFIQSTDGTYTSAAHAANGTTHLAWEGNGSTTGGLAGDWLEVTAISGTQWAVFGMGRATGAEATPWKTS